MRAKVIHELIDEIRLLRRELERSAERDASQRGKHFGNAGTDAFADNAER